MLPGNEVHLKSFDDYEFNCSRDECIYLVISDCIPFENLFKRNFVCHFPGEAKKNAPNVGLEPTTLRLRVSCSTD